MSLRVSESSFVDGHEADLMCVRCHCIYKAPGSCWIPGVAGRIALAVATTQVGIYYMIGAGTDSIFPQNLKNHRESIIRFPFCGFS